MKPYLDKQEKVLEKLVHRIYHHISSKPVEGDFSLLVGQTGYALFGSYYCHHFGIKDKDRVWDRLSASLHAIQEVKMLHTFAQGISGVAWGFLHLWNTGLLHEEALDANDIVAGLDEPLFELSIEALQGGNYDYLHGGLGACLYFLERRSTATIRRYLTLIVKQLDAIAVKSSNGEITWAQRDSHSLPLDQPPHYNLGLSHGVASIISVLGLLHQKGIAQARCASLMTGALEWLWNRRNRSKASLFPNVVPGPDHPGEAESRLAWCYGDLGVAHTLWRAGAILNAPLWRERAQATIRKACPRRNPEGNRVLDAGLCHGSVGVASLYQKFADYQYAPEVAETAQYWLQNTLQRALPEREENVYLQHDGSQENPYHPNLGLLEGEAGIGLVLLTHLGASPHWDRCLLLS